MNWLSNFFSSQSGTNPVKKIEVKIKEEVINNAKNFNNHDHIDEIKKLIADIDKKFKVNDDKENEDNYYENGREALTLKINAIKLWIPIMKVEEIQWHCNGGIDEDALFKRYFNTDEWDYYLSEDCIREKLDALNLNCVDHPKIETANEKIDREKEEKREKLEREKTEQQQRDWDKLEPEFPNMTVQEISVKLGISIGAVKGGLLRKKLEASDYDVRDLDIESIKKYGKKVEAIVCSHCQTRGKVRRTTATRFEKTRVNSYLGAAVGLGTNTSRTVTQMYCENCQTQWDV